MEAAAAASKKERKKEAREARESLFIGMGFKGKRGSLC